MTKEKKKKEKPVAMSLSEFRQSGTAEGIQCVPKSANSHSVKGLDDFLEWPDDSTIAVTQNHVRSNLQGQINYFLQFSSHSSVKPNKFICVCLPHIPTKKKKCFFHVKETRKEVQKN